ncbi:MAG: T9SS type A sorting domain-containing protein [Flavobacteriales bacterium]
MGSFARSVPALSALLVSYFVMAEPMAPPLSGGADNQLLAEVNNGKRSVGARGFEENKGQVRTADGAPAAFVKYRLAQGNTSIFLLGNGIAYQFNRMHYPEGYKELLHDRQRDPQQEERINALSAQVQLETFRMDMVLVGAGPDPVITTEGCSTDRTNYYNHDALDVHNYSRITYHSIYPGIDWVMYTTDKGLKYDFVVHPGADPSLIQLHFTDHEDLRLDTEGRLIHGNRMGRFIEERPVSYQDGNAVATHFLLEEDQLTFVVADHDRGRTLIIDPDRAWGTYYGSEEDEIGWSCATDATGNVYLAGETRSGTSIASGGHQNTFAGFVDAFLVKFDADGTRLWATYYGGPDAEVHNHCTVDAADNVYLVGCTGSTTGIASGGLQDNINGGGDFFVAKFDPDGTRLWATYCGGNGGENMGDCRTDPLGNLYVSGSTTSTAGLPGGGQQNTYGGGVWDGVLVKLDPDGAPLWSTYYGGPGDDLGYACATDPFGNVCLAGSTMSTNNISDGGHQNTFGGALDSYVVKFDSDGDRLWATYYGGPGMEGSYACDFDNDGNLYLSGETSSTTNIASNGHQNALGNGMGNWDAFLVKFDPAGIRLWGTYYGGTDGDAGYYCRVTLSGGVLLSGMTSSPNAIASNGFQNTWSAWADAFLAEFDPNGTRIHGTYLGGDGSEMGYSCAMDPTGAIYLAGSTNSTNNISEDGHQNIYAAGVNYLMDAFLVKFGQGGGEAAIDPPEIGEAELFPNPTNGLITIPTSRSGQHYAITDATGRTILHGALFKGNTVVDLTAQRAGLYLLLMSDQDHVEVIRVVKNE